MAAAKRARTAETPKQPSFYLRLRAPVFYSTIEQLWNMFDCYSWARYYRTDPHGSNGGFATWHQASRWCTMWKPALLRRCAHRQQRHSACIRPTASAPDSSSTGDAHEPGEAMHGAADVYTTGLARGGVPSRPEKGRGA